MQSLLSFHCVPAHMGRKYGGLVAHIYWENTLFTVFPLCSCTYE